MLVILILVMIALAVISGSSEYTILLTAMPGIDAAKLAKKNKLKVITDPTKPHNRHIHITHIDVADPADIAVARDKIEPRFTGMTWDEYWDFLDKYPVHETVCVDDFKKRADELR